MKQFHNHANARIWSLSEDQEIALKQLWAILLKFFGYDIQLSTEEIRFKANFCSSIESVSASSSPTFTVSSSIKNSDEMQSTQSSFTVKLLNDKIKSRYIQLESSGLGSDACETFSLTPSESLPSWKKYLPEEIHHSLWGACRNDSIDNFILRFLRSSKYDPILTVTWFVEVLEKRQNVFQTEELFFKGDAFYFFRKDKQKLIEAFQRNEVFLRGESKNHNPLFVIRVKEHIRGRCPDEDFQILILLMFEWGRLRLLEFRTGIDQCQVLFDLSGFTLKNADYNAIKFVIKAFQKYYPDYIDKIFVHNAPKIFTIMWNIIVRWIKSDLRAKIIFTHCFEDLNEFIGAESIPKSLGGKGSDETKYIPPNECQYERKEPDEMLGNLMRQRDELTVKFIEATIRWVEAPTIKESFLQLRDKIRLAKALAENWVLLDPYVRQRGVFDRNGELMCLTI